jgi:hypothetical protein
LYRKHLLDNRYDKELINSLKSKTTPSKPKLLQVTFADGTILENEIASQIFIKTIEKIGAEKVYNLGMNSLVRRDENFGRVTQIVQVDDYYVNTHSSTTEKKRQLEAISRKLNLNLSVEIKER